MIPFESGRGRGPSWRGRPGSDRPTGGPDAGWGGRLGAAPESVEPGSTWLEIPDGPRPPARAGRTRRDTRAAWFAAPLLLAAAAAGTAFVLRGPDQVFGVAFGLVVALGLGWVLISALFPARADRTCPQCGGQGLERLDPDSSRGVVCRLCAWADESASAFLLLEDEGRPFEDIVLRGREHGGGAPRG
jgi:hypothetical protein